MLKAGLKVYSINIDFIKDAISLYEKGLYQYIELYAFPHTYEKYIVPWKSLDIPFIIHAPHFSDGINLSRKEKEKDNLALAKDAIKFADALKGSLIIFHPGVEGQIEETARQLNIINDKRIVIENKPYYSNDEVSVCTGYSPEDINFVMNEAKTGFCLDFGHCICAANALHIDPLKYTDEFMKLKPAIFHLTDGDFTGVYDIHNHLGNGSYPLKKLISRIPSNSILTLETPKDSLKSLDDFPGDIYYLRNLL